MFNIDVRNQNIMPTRKVAFATKPMGIDTCSFTSFDESRQPSLRNIPNLPCACCGREMIMIDEFNDLRGDKLFLTSKQMVEKLDMAPVKFSNEEKIIINILKQWSRKYPKESFQKIATRDNLLTEISPGKKANILDFIKWTQSLGPTAKDVVERSEKYSHQMHPIEKEAYLKIRKLSHLNKQLTINQILNKPEVYRVHLQRLEQKQIEIIKTIETSDWKLSEPSKKLLDAKIEKAKNILLKETSDKAQKRGRVIELFRNFEETVPETQEAHKITELAYSLPNSSNNIDAFFVKYAKRTSGEIAARLIQPNAATIEHVKPRSRKGDRGDSSDSNYIVMCSKCNGQRSQTPYEEWLKIHPEMIENVQKQLDIIFNKMNLETISISRTYPEDIKEALDKESNGILQIDTSKWIPKTKEDRIDELLEKYGIAPRNKSQA